MWSEYPQATFSYKYMYQLFRNKYEIVTVIKGGTIKHSATSSCQNNLCLTQLKDWGKEKSLTTTVSRQFHAGSHAIIKAIDEMP